MHFYNRNLGANSWRKTSFRCKILLSIIFTFFGCLSYLLYINNVIIFEPNAFYGACKSKYQMLVMRFVRDFGRMRARSRVSGMEYALVPVLLGSDDSKYSFNVLKDLEENVEIISVEELANANGRVIDDSSSSLWICILGHVFDVSAGMKFYAPGKPYHSLTGNDATLQLARGDLNIKIPLISDQRTKKYDYKILKDDEIDEARRWLEYFATHDKYIHIGRIGQNDFNMDDIVEKQLREESVNHVGESSESTELPLWHPKVPNGMKKGKRCKILR
jgi:hypothetical protein